MIGTKLAHYEITSHLGTGGMGEVYQATDLKLGRRVAIKLLPAPFAADPDRLSRFRHEAKVLASLNHHNIAQIYGLEESGDLRCIVMELIEGETLQTRIKRGPIPLDETLTIATQIAEALESAHEKGIIHRDLKPGNVMLTDDGRVKVLDFGLAKAMETDASSSNLSQSPTLSIPATNVGVILGTAAYMSPEQIRGNAVDPRADIWAFGCVLFEMLTGRSPFGAPTVSESLAKVLEGPIDLKALPPNTPASIQRLVRRCLERSLRNRVQHIGDARADIADAKDVELQEFERSRKSTDSDARIAAVLVKRHSGAIALGAIGLVAAALGLFYLGTRNETGSSISSVAFALQDAEVVLLTTTGRAALPAISPDGRYVTYVQRDGDDESLWIRQTATASNVQIVPPRPGVRIAGATVTPDGNFVDFLTIEGSPSLVQTLWRVPFLGGTLRRLIDDVHTPVAWSPDGRRLAFVRGYGTANASTAVIVADSDGRNERVLVTVRQPVDAMFFTVSTPGGKNTRLAWSPDGRIIASPGAGFPGGVLTGYTLFVDVAGGSVKPVAQTPPGILGGWIDASTLVTERAQGQGMPSQLWLLSYRTGQLTRLTNDLSSYGGISLTADRDSFATDRTEDHIDIWMGDGSAVTGTTVITAAARPLLVNGATVAWSKDRLLYTGRSAAGGFAVAAFLPGVENVDALVVDADSPSATADGRMIVYTSRALATLNSLWKADSDGRNATQLAPDAAWPVVTPDGRRVVFASGSRTGKLTPWIVPIEGGTAIQIADFDARTPDVSADGSSVAFLSLDNQNRPTIVVCDLSACALQRRLVPPGLDLDGRIRWAPDGRGIAYVNRNSAPNIWIQPLDGSAPRQFTRFTDGRAIPDFAWSHDGARLAVVRSTTSTDIVLFKGLHRSAAKNQGH